MAKHRNAAISVDRDFARFGSKSYAINKKRWLGKSGQAAKWSFCLKAASMAAEQEMR
jgi:hypothetical protein